MESTEIDKKMAKAEKPIYNKVGAIKIQSIMKKFITIAFMLLISCAIMAQGIQSTTDKKIWREAKRAAKTLTKQGYKQRGPFSLVRQYYNFYLMYNSDKHIYADRYIAAPTDNLADTKASHNIKVKIASILGTYIEGVIRSTQDYNELSPNKRSQVDEILGYAREKFSSAIGDAFVTSVQAMKPRKKDEDNYSIYVLYLVDKEKVIANSKNVIERIQQDIKKSVGIDLQIDYKGEELNKKLNEIKSEK